MVAVHSISTPGRGAPGELWARVLYRQVPGTNNCLGYLGHAQPRTVARLLSSAEIAGHSGASLRRSRRASPAAFARGGEVHGRTQSASAAAPRTAAQDGVMVRPAAAGAHRRARDYLVRVR